MTFAIIQTGGKQYKVSPDQKLQVERLSAEKGARVTFDKVLLVADGDNVEIGAPFVEKASVEAEVLDQRKDDKKLVFRYHSKTRYRKKKGHRQPITEVKVVSINR